MKIKNYILLGLLPLALFVGACEPPNSTQTSTNGNTANTNNAAETAGQPTIEAAPVSTGDDNTNSSRATISK